MDGAVFGRRDACEMNRIPPGYALCPCRPFFIRTVQDPSCELCVGTGRCPIPIPEVIKDLRAGQARGAWK